MMFSLCPHAVTSDIKTPTDDITPVPEDNETLQTYIQDRRVIGVSL